MHGTSRTDQVADAWDRPATLDASSSAPDRTGLVPYLSILLFLVFMYGVVTENVPALGVIRPALTLGFGALVLLILEQTLTRSSFRLPWPEGYALLAFFAAAALSSFTALWPSLAVESGIELAKLLVLYILIVNVVNTRKRFRGLLWTMVVAGVMPAMGTVQNYLIGNVVEGRAAWIGKFSNPNILAFEVAILVPLAIALMVLAKKPARLLLGGLVVVYLVAIYFTYSRSGLLAIGVMLAVAVFRLRSPALRGAIIGCAIIGIALGLQFWERDDGFDDLDSDTTFNQRIASVQAAMAMFQSSPVFGIGIGCSLLGFEEFTPAEYVSGHRATMIHNTFAQALAETGIVGFTFFLLAILAPLWRTFLTARSTAADDPELHAYATAVELSFVALIVSGQANGYVEIAAPYLLIALASSLKVIIEDERNLQEA